MFERLEGRTAVALVVSFAVSAAAAWLLVPLSASILNRRLRTSAHGEVRWRASTVPRIAGPSLFLAWIAGWIAVPGTGRVGGLVAACTLPFLLIGLADDLKPQPWTTKISVHFAGAFCAIALLAATGVLAVHGPAAALCALGVAVFVNAVNMVDNMNGLAAGCVFLTSLGVLAPAWMQGMGPAACLAAALAGASLGFLRFNFPRARVFLGDGGSYFLGAAASLLVLETMVPLRPHVTFVAGCTAALLALPLADLSFVSARRLYRGLSPFRGGVDHLSHRLCYLGFGETYAVAILLLVHALFVSIGAASPWVHPRMTAPPVVALSLVLLGIGAVGYYRHVTVPKRKGTFRSPRPGATPSADA